MAEDNMTVSLREPTGSTLGKYEYSIFGIKFGISEILHLIAIIVLLVTYISLISTVQFSKPKDFFTNMKNEKKIIEKYDKNESKFLNKNTFVHDLHPDPIQQNNEILTNVVGFMLGITITTWIKVQFLDQISSDSKLVLIINIIALCLLVGMLSILYTASLKQQGDPTSEYGKIAYAFYPLLGGILLLGEVLIIRIGDGIANIAAKNGWNNYRGDLVTRNKINNLIDAMKQIFPNLKENITVQPGNVIILSRYVVNQAIG